MQLTYHHIDKWISANLDLIEEDLETHKKSVVFIAGASSSGKSYCADILTKVLESKSYKVVTISLDAYNHGIAYIIANKVNQNFYQGKLDNFNDIVLDIRTIIKYLSFEEKFSQNSLNKLKSVLSKYFNTQEELNLFIDRLNLEWSKLNFDEPSVYNLKQAKDDILALLNNETITKKEYSKMISEQVETRIKYDEKDFDIILVEGIYALNQELISYFNKDSIITNFIDSNPKTLFLRRVIRDNKITGSPTYFTISNYFKYIIKSYQETILPSKENAVITFINDMSFNELKTGDLYKSKNELFTQDKSLFDYIINKSILIDTIYEKDIYLNAPNESIPTDNILRLRYYSYDKEKTYTPSSLVHKGYLKIRRDNKKIRPINIFIKEGDFFKVFSSEEECLKAFIDAGFIIGKIEFKIKYRLKYGDKPLTIRYLKDKGYYIEFEKENDLIKEIKNKI